jgi:hypothetical protein
MYSLLSVFISLLFTINASHTYEVAQHTFTGTWQLDRASSASPYELLKAIGMASSKLSIASRLDITEVYVQTETTISVHRTTAYTDDRETHQFGLTTEKHDNLLGQGTQLMTLKNESKLIYHFVRHDGAVYHSVKEISTQDMNRMTVTMSFTSPGSDNPISCVRFFKRSSSSTTD